MKLFISSIRALVRIRVGVLPAYALISVIIASHNSDLQNRHKQMSEPFHARVLKLKEIATSPKVYPMGIPCQEKCLKTDDSWVQDLTSTTLDVEPFSFSASLSGPIQKKRKDDNIVAVCNVHRLSCMSSADNDNQSSSYYIVIELQFLEMETVSSHQLV